MRYRTIVADPPWPYDGFASDPTSGRGLAPADREPIKVTSLPYAAMSLGAIAALPLRSLASVEGCRLFCWTTNRYLPDTFGIVRGWGFKYVQALVWHKTGNPSPFGGSISPNHAEFLLVGVTGAIPVLSRVASNVISASAQRAHSRKPEVFLDIVEQVSPGPYLELFARRARFGWDYWGDESLGTGDLVAKGSETGEALLTEADRQRGADAYEAERLAQGTDFPSWADAGPEVEPFLDEHSRLNPNYPVTPGPTSETEGR